MKWTKRLWLKIRSRIKDLFGKRKMEIDETINKWFIQLDKELQCVDCQDEIYQYCIVIKSLVRNYVTSILLLLNKDKKLPAKVILRTIAELVIKFCWCMKGAKEDIEEFYCKNERWLKGALVERKKFLKRSLECFGGSDIQRNLKICENNLNKLKNIKNLPDNKGLCDCLFGNNSNLYYHILFGQFHEVVHSDLFLLGRLTISGVDKEISDYSFEDITVLKQVCLACVYLVLEFIYKYYGLDFCSIKSDYSRLKN